MARKYNKSERWIRNKIHAYQPTVTIKKPKEVVLALDATFFGKRTDKFGLIIAKDVHLHKPVSYHFIATESLHEYKVLLFNINSQGFDIKAAVIDGKRGLFRLLKDIPVQMCHFHQQAIITRYLTRKPKMKASVDLKRISRYLGKVSQKRFEYLLDCWYTRHENFIKEKSYSEKTHKLGYKHKRLRSAYRSLRTHLPYLFTYKNYPDLNIPNTTNSLDGGVFSPMKMLMKIHRGIGIEMKKKLIVDYLENEAK